MNAAEISKAKLVSVTQDAEKSLDDELQQLLRTLPKEEGWSGSSFYLYQGFRCSARRLKAVVCSTTWLQALTFSTLYRDRFARDQNPLLASTPRQLVRQLEYDVYAQNPCPDLENVCVYKTRLFGTTFLMLFSTSMKDSEFKIVYICRNPMDMFISLWLFTNQLREEN
ncbi:hypothetical protein V6N13_008884 [Hibiscus sabdariffa]|uniref:Sulfotransferase n=1 Tax=Hibiscus sabdariffa TaxID=183260 RepID=A0ABR2NQS7_9ROSI